MSSGDEIGTPIGIYGTGPRATAAVDAAQRSPRLELAARVDTASADDLTAALRRAPRLCWAVALGPRESARAVTALVDEGARAVVLGSPRGGTSLDLGASPGRAEAVRIAHGWVTLRAPWALARAGRLSGELVVSGLPDAHPADRQDVLAEAIAVASRLTPHPRLLEVGDAGGWFVVRGDRGELRITVQEGPPRITANLEVDGEPVRWSATGAEETLGGRRYPTRPYVERALAQVLAVEGTPARGDGVAEWAAGLALVAQLLDAAPPLTTPGLGALARPPARSGALGAIGLAWAAPVPSGAAVSELRVPTTEALELAAFRAGHKPAVFLTVHPNEEATIRGALGDGVHVERHVRRVARDARDRWVDDRRSGEPAVELFASRDPARAKRAARLQLQDPTENAAELGALLGYPRCCVEAFAAQSGRADNSYDRLQTAARTSRSDRWPWPLNDLALKVVPFYACRYDCPAALEIARRTVGTLPEDHQRALEQFLARPVLYFHDGEQLWLAGEGNRRTARVRRIAARGAGARALAALLRATAADELHLDAISVTASAGGEEVLRLERTDPGLGFIAPFR